MTWPASLDTVLFAVLPYVALFTFFLVTVQRYVTRKFTYSSLSSQFLENRRHFWALVPFHYAILVVLIGHLVAFLLPRQLLAWNGQPARLYVLEVSALVCGLLSLVGLVAIVVRRVGNQKVRIVTSVPDWIVYVLLFVQVLSGVLIAVQYPWGSSWFAAAMTPYLWSLVWLHPGVAGLGGLPVMVKLHIVNAFLLIGFFPFSRLVHILVVPNPYLWRKPQVVRWYRRPSEAA
jgi:nitrate reductase gamma subunit